MNIKTQYKPQNRSCVRPAIFLIYLAILAASRFGLFKN